MGSLSLYHQSGYDVVLLLTKKRAGVAQTVEGSKDIKSAKVWSPPEVREGSKDFKSAKVWSPQEVREGSVE